MEAFHPLAADADVSPEELAVAQAACTLALGRLDGLLAGLTDTEKRLFCVALLREVLLSAMVQGGFADAEHQFNAWFAGLDRSPQETPVTACSAYAVVRALLGELSHHPWEPLADAAVNGQRTLHPTPHANSPDRQNSLHRRYFLTPFNIRAAALDDGASLRP